MKTLASATAFATMAWACIVACSSENTDGSGGANSGGATFGGVGGAPIAGSGGSTAGAAGALGSTGGTSGGSDSGTGGVPLGGANAGGNASGGSNVSGGSSVGGATDAGGSNGGSESGGAAGAPGCATSSAWDVTYSMDGSVFDVRDTPLGAGDQTNTATPPYTEPNQFGPGTMVIRFTDAGGAPAAGTARVMSYTMDLEFTVGTTDTAAVNTDLTQDAVAGACGAATGTYDGSTIEWNAPGFTEFHTYGMVTCNGALCALGGLPDGTPTNQDDRDPLALNPFVFSNGVDTFTMEEVLIVRQSNSSTWLSFQGKETDRTAVCDCM